VGGSNCRPSDKTLELPPILPSSCPVETREIFKPSSTWLMCTDFKTVALFREGGGLSLFW